MPRNVKIDRWVFPFFLMIIFWLILMSLPKAKAEDFQDDYQEDSQGSISESSVSTEEIFELENEVFQNDTLKKRFPLEDSTQSENIQDETFDYGNVQKENFEYENVQDEDFEYENIDYEYSNEESVTGQDHQFQNFEIDLITQMVQHEVGSDPSIFSEYDFNLIQKYMARVIINRIGLHSWSNVYDVLTAENQFCDLSELESFAPDEPTTRANVLAVISGEDNLSDDILYEMSWSSDVSPEEAIMKMEKQVGKIDNYVYFYATWDSGYSRLLVFASQKI